MWRGIFFLVMGLVSACVQTTKPYAVLTREGVSPEKALALRGMHVATVGHNLIVSVPTDAIFYSDSPNLLPTAQGQLTALAQYLSPKETVTVSVTGFTDNRCSAKRAHMLSQQRAQIIADFVWHAGLDARWIYVKGAGQARPVATNDTLAGRAQNRRVEIRLKLKSL